MLISAPVAQLVEHPAVNRQVTGSSPVGGASLIWPVGEAVNTHAFHACIHGFKSRTGHHFISECRILAITSAFQADEVGSIPIIRSIYKIKIKVFKSLN